MTKWYYACGSPHGEWIKVWSVGSTPQSAVQKAKEAILKAAASNPDSWSDVYSDFRVFEIEEWLYSELRNAFRNGMWPVECIDGLSIRAMSVDAEEL